MFDFLLVKPDVKPLYPDELKTVQNYQDRLDRDLTPEVESSCGPARPQSLLIQPGHNGLTQVNAILVDGPVKLTNVEVVDGCLVIVE